MIVRGLKIVADGSKLKTSAGHCN